MLKIKQVVTLCIVLTSLLSLTILWPTRSHKVPVGLDYVDIIRKTSRDDGNARNQVEHADHEGSGRSHVNQVDNDASGGSHIDLIDDDDIESGNHDEHVVKTNNEMEKSEATSESRKPDIIFILGDDHGFHDIGYHGRHYGRSIYTPVMDSLSADGVRLENYYVQPMCSPTRSQLMTGRYQIHLGMTHYCIRHAQPQCLPLDETLLPEKLRESGYSNHIVGKWHLGLYKADCLPQRRGFDSFFGALLGNGDHYTHSSAKQSGHINAGYDLHENDSMADPILWKGKYSTTIYTDRAIDIINKQDKSKPLFLYVAYQAVHVPMQEPNDHLYEYTDTWLKNPSRKKYAGMVSYMDYSIGRIVDAMKAAGRWNNTVLIYSSDNGGSHVKNGGGYNWPLRGRKQSLWEGGIRAIGFVNSPLIPVQSRGRVSYDLMHVTDWFPTIVQGIAGGSLDGIKPLDGYDVWETIRSNKPTPRKEILHNIDPLEKTKVSDSRYSNDSALFQPVMNAAIRVGDWKLVIHEKKPGTWLIPPELEPELKVPTANSEYQLLSLFNIKSDQREMFDMAETKPNKVRELLARLQYYKDSLAPVYFPNNDPLADPKNYNGMWVPWGEKDTSHFSAIYKT